MSVTTFEGIVENGRIRLPTSVRLPENAKVYVGSPRLVHPEQATDLQKEIVEENRDADL